MKYLLRGRRWQVIWAPANLLHNSLPWNWLYGCHVHGIRFWAAGPIEVRRYDASERAAGVIE